MEIKELFPAPLSEGRVRKCKVNTEHRIPAYSSFKVAHFTDGSIGPICDDCEFEYLKRRYNLK